MVAVSTSLASKLLLAMTTENPGCQFSCGSNMPKHGKQWMNSSKGSGAAQ
jgi:hypothetical protein